MVIAKIKIPVTKLSIITINYNNRNGLEKTIGSVVGQTFDDFEYLIIDGGSKDGSVEIIQQHAGKVSYWISESDSGIYNAMNKGIKLAKGEYCLFLNSGDYLLNENVLRNVSDELNGDAIIYGNGRMEKGSGKSELVNMPQNLTLEYFSSRSIFHPSTFIKRELFDTYGLYNESNKIVSDWEFFIKTIMVANVKARKIPNEIAVVEDGGISRNVASQEILQQEIRQVLGNYFPQSVLNLIEDQKRLRFLNQNELVKSKRFEMLSRIEQFSFPRKMFTVLMKTCIFFLPKEKNEN